MKCPLKSAASITSHTAIEAVTTNKRANSDSNQAENMTWH